MMSAVSQSVEFIANNYDADAHSAPTIIGFSKIEYRRRALRKE